MLSRVSRALAQISCCFTCCQLPCGSTVLTVFSVTQFPEQLKVCVWCGNPPQSYRASRAIWDHTVLPVTRLRWASPP